MSSTSKIVFGRLCQYAGQDGQAYPSYKVLGDEVGVNRRQAMRSVQELEAFGLIKSIGRRRTDGGTTSNIYEFVWHEILEESLARDPSVLDGTGGSDNKGTRPRCSKRHLPVPDSAPKKNHRQESPGEKNTNEQIRILLLNTPFSKVTDQELDLLIDRHGLDCLKERADIAAELWRKSKKEILNPTGYLQNLCSFCSVPEWYEKPEVRDEKRNAIEERKRIALQKEQEEKAAMDSEDAARDEYWSSLFDEEKRFYIDAARKSSIFASGVSDSTIEMVAKYSAWDQCSKMRKNGSVSL